MRQFSQRTELELREIVREHRQKVYGTVGDTSARRDAPGSVEVRWAQLTTNSTYPVYPVAPATKFLARLGNYDFDDTILTTETAAFTAYDDTTEALDRIVYSPAGWLPEDTVVRVAVHHGKWFVVEEPWMRTHKAVVTKVGGITAGGSGEVTIYKAGAATAWTETAYLNWMQGGTAAAQNSECLIEWFPDESKWVITALEC